MLSNVDAPIERTANVIRKYKLTRGVPENFPWPISGYCRKRFLYKEYHTCLYKSRCKFQLSTHIRLTFTPAEVDR